jgi:hypothetical protein
MESNDKQELFAVSSPNLAEPTCGGIGPRFLPCALPWECYNPECVAKAKKYARATLYADRWYNRYIHYLSLNIAGLVYATTCMVIPICGFLSVGWKRSESRLIASRDVVHPNIRIFKGLHSKRLRAVQMQEVGTTKGRFPMCFLSSVRRITSIEPYVILLWPIWELKDCGRLPGLLPPVDSDYVHAMQLSFNLSQWARNDDLWVFLPFESIVGTCNENQLMVEFDETPETVSVAKETVNREKRIWEYPGIRVVFYKTKLSLEDHRLNYEQTLPREHIRGPLDKRADQALLTSWMTEAVGWRQKLKYAQLVKEKFGLEQISLNPGTPFSPDMELIVKVHELGADRPIGEYTVSTNRVCIVGFSV